MRANFVMLEMMMTDAPQKTDATRIRRHNGKMVIPDRVGIGIELNEENSQHPYIPTALRHYRGDLTNIRPPERDYYKIIND